VSKKCRYCGEKFTPRVSSLQICCSVECSIEYAKEQRHKAVKKQYKKQQKEAKEKLKTRSDYLKEAQADCNTYIRERDKFEGCISCDKPAAWQGQWHASHYRPQGNCSALRFHPLNIHKACSQCNNHKSGNLIEYRIRLIRKIGQDAVEWLEAQNAAYKWDIDDVKEIKAYFKECKKAIINARK